MNIKQISFIIISLILLYGIARASEPLNMEQCIEMAKRNNQSIDIAKTQLKIYNSKVQEARAGKFPSFKAGGTLSQYNYQSGYENVSLRHPVDSISNFPQIYLGREGLEGEFGVGIEQIIYDGGRIDAQILVAKTEEENARLNLIFIEENVIYNVKIAFYSALKAKEKVTLSAENLKSGEENLKLSLSLFKLGIVPEVDAISAEVALARAKMLSNQARNEYEKARGNLNMLIGKEIREEIEIDEKVIYIPIKINEELALNKALENRIEMKQLKVSMEQGQINITELSFSPTISANAGYILRNYDSMGRKNFYFEVGVNFPVFNILAYKAKSERAEATQDESEKQKRLLEEKIKLETVNALLDLNSAQENTEVANQEVDLAKLALKISEEKYRQGVGNILELTTAQLSLIKAQTDYLDSIYNYKIAIATIEHVSGTKIEEIQY
ncbi:MAG TPA: TolC family protein [Candidatus Eremiobacteraeota bacterium]|nr:MAG: Antibiotic efflux pump outer membrane protein ArpC precursor [bacterium ADurb.Bin363]HPZ08927.1 TolC family protein [Candidatus Eremiobacteraeota bacterium]